VPPDVVTRRGRAALTPLLVVCGALAAIVAAGLTVASGGQNYAALGLPDAGPVTEDGLAVLSVLTEVGAAVCIGSLLLAAFLVPPRPGSRVLAADGYAAVRTAGWAALVWCVSSLLTVPFTAADALGRPVYRLTTDAMFPLVFQLDQPRAWLLTAGIALVLAIACTQVLTWGWSVTLWLVALAGLLPLAATGHSSAGGSHDIATDSLLYHLVAAALWVGGLVALLAHARRGGAHLPLATRRFSALAAVCWLVMAVSGVLNALVRMSLGDLFTTTYGLLVLAKIVALLLLGVLGYLQRQRSVRALLAGKGSRELLRLAGVELLVMFVTIGVAAALSRTAPPAADASAPSLVASQIGYDLPGPATAARLLFDWRFDLVYGVLAILLAVSYSFGVRRLRVRGEHWPAARTTAWLLGCLLVLLATSSGVGRYAPAVFSVHLAAHLTLSLPATALLVLGSPVTLALRALPGNDQPGPREWLVTFESSAPQRFLTHPVVALVLFAGSFYGLYTTGLFGTALNYHWAHLAMNALFLVVGCVFHRAAIRHRWLWAAVVPFLALFAVLLLTANTAVGATFYTSLGLPWLTNPLADQRLGAWIALVAGVVVPLVLLAGRPRVTPRADAQPTVPQPKQPVSSTVD
jgi:putative copper resistance protein D